jgi:hypothetical protein
MYRLSPVVGFKPGWAYRVSGMLKTVRVRGNCMGYETEAL